MPGDSSVQADVTRLSPSAAPLTNKDSLAVEEPLEIRVRSHAIAVTMRTPGHDEELAAGFLLSEGLLKRRGDIVEIAHCRADPEAALSGNILNVFLAPDVVLDLERLTRHVFSASSCGLCGKASIETVHQQFPPLEKPLEIPLHTLLTLPPKLRAAQTTFDSTGGLHAAGLFTSTGELIIAREDIGRHNAVDKVLGRHNAVDKVLGYSFLKDQIPLNNHILMVSGRASFEILQKALAAGVRCIAAVSAPSSLAVEFARESNQCLYGFVREKSANRYA